MTGRLFLYDTCDSEPHEYRTLEGQNATNQNIKKNPENRMVSGFLLFFQ